MKVCVPEHIKAIHKVESEEHKSRSHIEHPTENVLKEVKSKENCVLPLQFK